ncbi:hypothetical protein O9X98_06640 [Agrobacterium salinitolerans]|nr:hypothetical protein [Agrobacterium salinitolerans]
MLDLNSFISSAHESLRTKIADTTVCWSLADARIFLAPIIEAQKFEVGEIGSYLESFPTMLQAHSVGQRSLQRELELSFRSALSDTLLRHIIHVLERQTGFAESLVRELGECCDALDDLFRVAQFALPTRSVQEVFDRRNVRDEIFHLINRIRLYTRHIQDEDQSSADFGRLSNVIKNLRNAFVSARFQPGQGDRLSRIESWVNALAGCEVHAQFMEVGLTNLPRKVLPTRYVGVVKVPQPASSSESENSIRLRRGRAFLASFQSDFGMEPLEFVTVRESLKHHYTMHNPAVMQVLFDHFGLSAKAWDDGFDVVSRNAKSSLRAAGKLKFTVLPRKELDVLVMRTFGKTQGFHNYRHVPSFTSSPTSVIGGP